MNSRLIFLSRKKSNVLALILMFLPNSDNLYLPKIQKANILTSERDSLLLDVAGFLDFFA